MRKRVAMQLAAVALIGVTAGAALAAGDDEAAGSPMPVPGAENVDETIVEPMPVPGAEGVDETIVVSGYPAPGFEDVEEAIVEG